MQSLTPSSLRTAGIALGSVAAHKCERSSLDGCADGVWCTAAIEEKPRRNPDVTRVSSVARQETVVEVGADVRSHGGNE